MGRGTKIEWTQDTWQPITGCSVVSPGCTNCYAMKLAGTRLRHHPSRAGLTVDSKAGPVWNGQVRFNEEWLTQPLGWKKPRMIFVCAHGDLFHESVPDEWIDKVFAVMALSPQHTFQVLTKRSKRMRDYLTKLSLHAERDARNELPAIWQQRLSEANPAATLPLTMDCVRRALGVSPKFSYDPPTPQWPLPNVWLGVSTEDQQRADERIPDLLATPAAVRWISAEPLVGPIDLTKVGGTTCLATTGSCCGDKPWLDALRGIQGCSRAGAYGYPLRDQMPRGLDWVVVGGESGNGARPMHPDWARSLRDQCAAAGVAFFFKQWGAWIEVDGEHRDVDGDHELVDADDADEYLDPRRDGLIAPDGRLFTDASKIPLNTRCRWVSRVGKKAAGRLLDGVEHNAMPEAR